MSLKSPQERLAFRRLRARRKIFGTAEKPRLSVYRAQRHMYAQLVDDAAGRTLAAASSVMADLKTSLKTGATVRPPRKSAKCSPKRRRPSTSAAPCSTGADAPITAASRPWPTEPARRV